MKKSKFLKISMIALFALCGLGLALAIVGNAINHSDSEKYTQWYDKNEDRFAELNRVYINCGISKNLEDEANYFLDNIPGQDASDNNIVIVSENGKILYKANNSYLPPDMNVLSSAWFFNTFLMKADSVDNRFIEFSIDGINSEPNAGTVNYPTDAGAYSDIRRTNNFNTLEMSLYFERYNMNEKHENIRGLVKIYEILNDPERPNSYLFWFHRKDFKSVINECTRFSGNKADFMTTWGVLIVVLYWLLTPVWVFLDARRRQSQPLPWALLVLLTNIVGLVVYWIVQSQNSKINPALACPACGKPVQKSHLFCPWCAAPLKKICKACGKALDDEWVACPWCGKPE